MCSACGCGHSCHQCYTDQIKSLNDKNKALNDKIEGFKAQKRKVILTISLAITITIGWNFSYLHREFDLITRTAILLPPQSDPIIQIPPLSHYPAFDFVVRTPEEDINLTVNVECQNCPDYPLTMFLLDEYDYRGYQDGVAIQPIHQSNQALMFVLGGRRPEGHYYLIFHNSSDRVILAKIQHRFTYN